MIAPCDLEEAPIGYEEARENAARYVQRCIRLLTTRIDRAEAERDRLATENAGFLLYETVSGDVNHGDLEPRTRLMLAYKDVGENALSWAEDIGECVFCELDDDGRHAEECSVGHARAARDEASK